MPAIAALRNSAGAALVGATVLFTAAAAAQAPEPRHLAAAAPVSKITLVKGSDGVAAIRVGAGPLEKARVGDQIGKTKATVKEIATGRLVLEETFTAEDGRPNRALIIIKEGERGGTRYLQRRDEPRIIGTKPTLVTPAAPAVPQNPPKQP
jgi:hypothetical protein